MKASHRRLGLLVALMLFFNSTTFSQNRTIDSLKALLPTNYGEKQLDIIFEIARAYSDLDYEMCFKYSSEAYKLALKSADTFSIVKAGRIKAQAFRRLTEMDSALALFNNTLPIARRHNYQGELKILLNAMGTAYMLLAQQDKALECYFESVTLSELDNDEYRMSAALNNIGLIYLDLGDYKKGMLYLKRALVLRDKIENQYDLESVLINIALCSVMQDNFTEGHKYLDRARAVCGKNCSANAMGYIYNVSGTLFFKKGDLESAAKDFRNSKMLCEVFRNDKINFSNLSYLLTISIMKNQTAKAEGYLNEIENLIASGVPYNFQIISVYPQVFSYYLKLKDYEKAALYQSKYVALKDSIYSKELTTNLMRIEAEHLEKENLAKIDSQNKILALNDKVIRTQKFLIISVGIVALLLIVLIVVLGKSNRLKQKHNVLLDKKVQERTHQLQINHDTLQRASLERDIVLEKISADINNALSTLKGLGMLGMKDVNDPHALEYISKMYSTSDSFSNILAKLHFIRSGAARLK